jgi:hypothetical protein
MNKRRSERMKAVLPIRISGYNADGTFCDIAHTLDIGRTGARLGSIRRPFEVGEPVVVQYRHRKVEYKVVWTKTLKPHTDHWVGLRSIEQRDPWGIYHSTALLDENELSAIGTAQSADGNSEILQAPPQEPRRARAKMKMTACIMQPGSETLVDVVNVSREGLCFRSAREFAANTLVRVAAPYTAGGSNIFVIGRITWSRAAENAHEYGINYVRQYSGEDVWDGAR